MHKKLVICEINETYLKSVKDQMKKQNMPIPKDDSQITIAHKPITVINIENLSCNCEVCQQIRKQ